MTTTPALRVHGAIDGRGTAYDEERLLAEVDYALKDVEETPAAAFFGGGASGVDGTGRGVFGLVTAGRSHLLDEYVGARLTLQLRDGRWLDFTVAKVLGPTTFLVQGLGGFRSDRWAPPQRPAGGRP